MPASDNISTLHGNATRDPELRFTKGGMAVAKFGIAVNRRWQNRQTNEWDEKVTFVDVIAWGQLAENVAESVNKGDRVMVVGRLDLNQWENDAGEKRSKLEFVADGVGVSLSYATVPEIKRNPKKDGGGRDSAPIPDEPDFGHGDFAASDGEEPF